MALCSWEIMRLLSHLCPLSRDLEGLQLQCGCGCRPGRPRGPGPPLTAAFFLQVIQEVSGLPSEGASEGNQSTPEAQRLNCQKVRLYSAWKASPIPCLLPKNETYKIGIFGFCVPAQLVSNAQCLDKAVASAWQETDGADADLEYLFAWARGGGSA